MRLPTRVPAYKCCCQTIVGIGASQFVMMVALSARPSATYSLAGHNCPGSTLLPYTWNLLFSMNGNWVMDEVEEEWSGLTAAGSAWGYKISFYLLSPSYFLNYNHEMNWYIWGMEVRCHHQIVEDLGQRLLFFLDEGEWNSQSWLHSGITWEKF